MQSTVIISGLIGALSTAILSFIVRLVLDKRSQREAQKRLAYVYLVRVSEVIASEIVVKSFLEAHIGEKLRKNVLSEDDKFELSHAICVLISKKIKEAKDKGEFSTKEFNGIAEHFRLILSQTLDSRLSPEQLSKLPKEAVYTSHKFQKQHDQMLQTVELWCSFLENNEYDFWITSQGLHDQWLTIERFIDSAKKMRVALISYGAATSGEADRLLRRQVDDIHNAVHQRLDHAIPIAAAEKSYKEELKKEQSQNND